MGLLIPDWPVCGNCREVAYFRWMGGAHACDGPDTTQVLTVGLEEQPRRLGCGTSYRVRTVKNIVIEGAELRHLVRYMERIHDDDEVDEVTVRICADGTLQFFAAGFILSAVIGADDPDGCEPW